MVRAQLLGERPKGKYTTAKQLNGPKGLEIVLKLGKCNFSDESTLQNYFFCKPLPNWRLKHEKNYPHYINGCVKFTVVVLRELARNFKGVSQLKLVNETITSKAYQDNIKSDIKLQYECTMPQAFNKITHLATAL